jgi:hypothetical protein
MIFPTRLELVNLETTANLDRTATINFELRHTQESSSLELGSERREFEVWSAKEAVSFQTGSRFAAFLRGLGSVLAIFPSEDYLPVGTHEDALSRDFAAVGEDLARTAGVGIVIVSVASTEEMSG